MKVNMSNQFKFSILIIFLLFGCSSDHNEFYQGDYDEKNKTCVAKELAKHVFKVNVETQQVMHTVTDSDGNVQSAFRRNCKVINSNNFICGENGDSRITLSDNKLKFEASDTLKKMMNTSTDITSNCWYKKQLFWMKEL